MQIIPTPLHGAYIVELEPAHDNRGFFARTFCMDAFAEHGLEQQYPQHSISFSARRGTLRGLHFQREPYSEAKLIRCTSGSILDVIVDIRRDSPSFRRWQKFELSSANGSQLYVPKGFAHGFQTLCDDVEVSYLISTRYEPAFAGGIRYDDPAFDIDWPLPVVEVSERDLRWPGFSE
ncbi:dTDP-4-dehydrorhamnose 3,5-epimerase [Bradyrhizobium sp. CCBAU 11386]|uniref:dTDP-4-dehydrorhamnose 3,5-epimerase n=1 Tax=Bradyrhizobium sp. CCBAU 11386 TaxID=1630837 RepID=UPI002303C56E|nr:dTDP-4-dehydrorhamnose 3,5-epimerase [Bradyrhizobium sp. CCBAU 11386]MDA9503458.1 dTDP-4-dehydrorhamnose 3,5-epimerase [Bradyrhizobium sp. CCBAU 11386]